MMLSKLARSVIAVGAVVDVLLFISAGPLALLAISVGAITILFGIVFAYKPAAISGLLIVSIAAGVSIQIPTLTELGYILMTMLGLLLPILVLFWLCFSDEEGEAQVPVVRPSLWAVAFAVTCMLSVPLFVMVLGFLAPALSISLAIITEIAVMLLTATVLGIALLWRQTRASKSVSQEGGEA